MSLPSAPRPIPMPPAQRWRELRQRHLPWVVFGGGVWAAVLLWAHAVAPAAFVAEVEVVQADVRCPQAGRLRDLPVAVLQTVSEGMVLGYLDPVEPAVREHSLGALRAEIEYLRTSLEPVVGQQRAELAADRLQLDWMRERVGLAALRAQSLEAADQLARVEQLYRQRLATEASYLTARHLHEGLEAQLAEQAQLVERLQPAIARAAAPADAGVAPRPQAALAAAIQVQEEKLRLVEAQLAPIPLRAPFAGIVAQLHHRSGETLLAGDAVVALAAPQPARLVGFLRQPLNFEPRVGMRVELRTRTSQRQVGYAVIEQVGSLLEPIPPSLLAATNRPPGTLEKGLRVLIGLPAGFPVRPGEWVEVILLGNPS